MMAVQRLIGLDVVRALAIALVVMAHGVLLLWSVIPPEWRLQLIYVWGYFGVELFFALSGLLIVGGLLRQLEQKPTLNLQDMWRFWRRRWWRTLPNYFVFLLLNATLFAAWFNAPAPSPNYMLFWQNLAWPHPAAMAEAWSLAVEEWSYLLLPVLLATSLWVLPHPRRTVPVLLAGWIIAGTLIRFAVADWAEPAWDSGMRKVVLLRFDAIAWGGLAACWLHYCPRWAKRTSSGSLVLGLVALMVCVGWLILGVQQDFQPVISWAGLFTVTGFSLALCLPAAALWQASQASRYILGPITWLSRISYSLYLVHLSFALPLMQLCVSSLGLPLAWAAVGYVGTSILLAWGAYRLIERPTLVLRDRLSATAK